MKPKCRRGHTLAWGQVPTACEGCREQDAVAVIPAAQYREQRRRELGLGPPPDVMTVRSRDGVQIFRFRPRRR